jgi:hypothetical protein
VIAADLRRRHLLFTMLTTCAWRDSPSGPAPVVAGIRTSSVAALSTTGQVFR